MAKKQESKALPSVNRKPMEGETKEQTEARVAREQAIYEAHAKARAREKDSARAKGRADGKKQQEKKAQSRASALVDEVNRRLADRGVASDPVAAAAMTPAIKAEIEREQKNG